jgi:hypothetical protein
MATKESRSELLSVFVARNWAHLMMTFPNEYAAMSDRWDLGDAEVWRHEMDADRLEAFAIRIVELNLQLHAADRSPRLPQTLVVH